MQNNESNEFENFSPPVKSDVLPPDLSPVSPDNPPWNGVAAIGVWVASILLLLIVPNLLLVPYILTKNVGLADRGQLIETLQSDPKVILLSIIGVIPAHLLTLLVAWLVVTNRRKFSFRKILGWQWNGFNIWTCVMILGGFFILAAIVSHFVPEQENELLRILKGSRSAVFVVAFLASFTAPLVEEVVYRGILYSAFQRAVGVPAAVALVTFLFALVHVPQYLPSYSTIFLICLLSLILTLIRVRTKNLLPCVALHTVFNGTQSLLLILQPYIEKYVESPSSQAASLIHLFK